uniref:Reverse transcriptase Ty1/copia-type domain-containing protein n=1 Tax=Rhizophora mucronata TaxID=61149 RepID=A0A2P2PH59_RHIMU
MKLVTYGKKLILIIYVENIILTGDSIQEIDKLKRLL